MPLVSVLMPVYNAERYLRDAMDSIFAQTFGDFEFVVVDDGSTDSTPSMLAACTDVRLRVLRNERNLGVIASLNRGLESARSEFVARMDADDVSHPDRLAVQVEFMRDKPEVGLVGAWYRPIGAHPFRVARLPTTHEDICAWLPFHCPIAHPTAFLRREVFASNQLDFDMQYRHAEDYDLWSRAAQITRLANIPRPLLRYRMHLDQVTSRHRDVQAVNAKRVRGRELARLLPDVTSAEVDFHQQIVTCAFEQDPDVLGRIEGWLSRLSGENMRVGAFSRPSLDRVIEAIWRAAALTCMPRPWALARYARSPLTGIAGHRAAALAGFAARALKGLATGRAAG
ncbi:MAG TPA: glycosyltransferase [Burkholderiales bacterium]|nr:glycosyltransferase [Burkholderiales bacterium]